MDRINMKKVECCECGKEVEVPDDIAEEEIAVFCSKECVEADAKAIYMQERQQEYDRQVDIAEQESKLRAEEEYDDEEEHYNRDCEEEQ
jgi:endogenous inhibitor of DNA gyrase (YacG/DUF329 family)